ncbi:MAG: hypothetical protein JNG83_07660 [Opitutaceae bacterium]|nr:hypothetical protein [Opitutaceae bacterium]
MIKLAVSFRAGPEVHDVSADPGFRWTRDEAWAIDAPPDGEPEPRPEARWPESAPRTGAGGAVSPRIVALPGGYRLFYTQLLPRPGFPAGAADYDNATARILSAWSIDGAAWVPEPGVRLAPAEGGAGEFRVVSSEVVPVMDGGRRLRMYYECCPGPQSGASTIRSAVSDDDGRQWRPEPGVRFGDGRHNYSAPRVVFLPDGRCRLFCGQRGRGIVSAVSADGLDFVPEPGVRLGRAPEPGRGNVFAPEIVRLPDGSWVMYYADYVAANRAHILRATSDNALDWRPAPTPVLVPGGRWDAAKCSEMGLLERPAAAGGGGRFRMLYEGCDGTARGERGVWRLLGATAEA